MPKKQVITIWKKTAEVWKAKSGPLQFFKMRIAQVPKAKEKAKRERGAKGWGRNRKNERESSRKGGEEKCRPQPYDAKRTKERFKWNKEIVRRTRDRRGRE